jgi:AcrR family transcriptional regulator
VAHGGPHDQSLATEPVKQSRQSSWREQAVARSLGSARTRAESRVQRFLDAAVDLMDNRGGKEFTVQEVVEQSGQSLRSFYQYFGGKHELLLAVFEEALRATADQLRTTLADVDDPLERLRRFVVQYYVQCRPAPQGPSGTLIEFSQQLLTAHPTEAVRAFAPIVSLFEEILDDAAAAGAIRDDLRRRQIVGVVLESIMFNAFSATIAGESAEVGKQSSVGAAEELWDLLIHGITSGHPASRWV